MGSAEQVHMDSEPRSGAENIKGNCVVGKEPGRRGAPGTCHREGPAAGNATQVVTAALR